MTAREFRAESLRRVLAGRGFVRYDDVVRGLVARGWTAEQSDKAFDDLTADGLVAFQFGGLAERCPMVGEVVK